MSRKSVADWTREAMLDSNYGKIVAIILSFNGGFGPSKEVDNITFGDRQWDPKELEERFLGKCSNYCGNTEGRHEFVVQAIYDSSSMPRNEMNFFYDVQGESFTGINRNDINEKGLLKQMMMHTEVYQERILRMSELVARSAETQIERLSGRLEKAEKENHDAWDIIREMGNNLMDKRQEHALAQLKYKRDSETMQVWMKFGPALINQILGREVFPQGTADTSLIEAIAESLDDDTIGLLAERMKPELWGVCANRFTEVLETKKRQSMKDEKILAVTHTTPEDNAAGDSIVKSEFIQ